MSKLLVVLSVLFAVAGVACGGAAEESSATDAPDVVVVPAVDAAPVPDATPAADAGRADADASVESVDVCTKTDEGVRTCRDLGLPEAWTGVADCETLHGLPRRELTPGQYEHRPDWTGCEFAAGRFCCAE